MYNVRGLDRHIEECLNKYCGFTVEQLAYESVEGGYQGVNTWSAYARLTDEIELRLPRQRWPFFNPADIRPSRDDARLNS